MGQGETFGGLAVSPDGLKALGRGWTVDCLLVHLLVAWGECHVILYKYTTLDGMIKTVRGASLLVPRPINGYNDPFECLPVFSDESIEAYFNSLCRSSHFLRRLKRETHILGEPYTVPQLRLRLKNDPAYRKSVLRGLLAQSKAAPIEFAKDFQAP